MSRIVRASVSASRRRSRSSNLTSTNIKTAATTAEMTTLKTSPPVTARFLSPDGPEQGCLAAAAGPRDERRRASRPSAVRRKSAGRRPAASADWRWTAPDPWQLTARDYPTGSSLAMRGSATKRTAAPEESVPKAGRTLTGDCRSVTIESTGPAERKPSSAGPHRSCLRRRAPYVLRRRAPAVLRRGAPVDLRRRTPTVLRRRPPSRGANRSAGERPSPSRADARRRPRTPSEYRSNLHPT